MGVTDHFLSQPPFPQQNCTLGGAAPALNCPQAPGGRRPSRRSHPEDRPGAPGAGADVTAHGRCTRHSSGLGWPAGLQDQGRPPRTWARPGGPCGPQATQLCSGENPQPTLPAREPRAVPAGRPPGGSNLLETHCHRAPASAPPSPLHGRLTCFHRDCLLVCGGHLGDFLEGGGILQDGNGVRGQDPRLPPHTLS